jgi:hypothetical protein
MRSNLIDNGSEGFDLLLITSCVSLKKRYGICIIDLRAFEISRSSRYRIAAIASSRCESYLKADWIVNVYAPAYSSVTRRTVSGRKFPLNGADPAPTMGYIGIPISSDNR